MFLVAITQVSAPIDADLVFVVVGDADVVLEQLEPIGLPIEVRELPADE